MVQGVCLVLSRTVRPRVTDRKGNDMTITSRLRSRKVQLGAGAAVLALVGSGLALTSGGSAAADGDDWPSGWPTELATGDRAPAKVTAASDRVIRFTTNQVRNANVDADSDGQFGPGDYFVFEERLRRGGEQVGRDFVRCMLNHRAVMCDGTLVYGPGNIEIAGNILFEERGIHLAVTGGTGEFRDAAGTLTVKPGGTGPADRLIVRLVD